MGQVAVKKKRQNTMSWIRGKYIFFSCDSQRGKWSSASDMAHHSQFNEFEYMHFVMFL